MRSGALISSVAAYSDVIEIEYRNGTYYGLQLSDFCGTIDQQAQWFKVFKPTVITASPVTVPANFMGLTVENVGCGTNTATPPWSCGVAYGVHRLLGQGTYWAEIETSDGVFNWTKMDAAVTAAVAAGKDVMWNVAYTPGFHSSKATAKRSSGASTAGWSAPPADIAGTLQAYPSLNSAKWARFVTAAVQRYAGRIKYYVMWNEPNYRTYSTASQANAPCGNWFEDSDTTPSDLTTPLTSVAGNQNYTRFVQLQADLYGIVHQYDPAAIVIGCDMYGEQSSQSTGGKQAGATTFAAWLAAGGASYCDAYGWHNYMDEYLGINGVSLRLNAFLDTIEAARVSAGAAAKSWYGTETGHNNLGDLALTDQKLWIARNAIIAAARGWKSWVMYAWDSLNASTQQMSLWAPSTAATSPGLRANAAEFIRWAGILQGATISNAAVLNCGKVCATINGAQYVV